MPSTLAWIDHDTRAQDRARRIIALFQERGTVDQMGIGSIRDSFADLFFPGTSTIQTRLRYFLFVPWIYQRIEQEEVPSRRAAEAAREIELALVLPLLSAHDGGIFGSMAGQELKRLPSEVYWGGLGSWGIRRFDASPGRYHRGLDELYRRRKRATRDHSEDDVGEGPEVTWHPELPAPPPGFPESATISLRAEEAEFLRDRIVHEHPDSLLAWLVLHPANISGLFPWEHAQLSAMPEQHRSDLVHARLFSETMAGAPILYNRMLAELLGDEKRVREYTESHVDWIGQLDLDEVAGWNLDALFSVARRQRLYNITVQTERFVRDWVELTVRERESLHESDRARQLIDRRERALKRGRSLFANRRAREELYSGGLGMGQLDYRWAGLRTLLGDLYAGLGA